jgi:nicotinic acid mononucleotide adenylyltransferase
MDARIAQALESLDAESAPAALLFDMAAGLSGHAVVLPSAFNPPTVGHTALLREASRLAAATSQLALLTTRNVDKGIHGASLAERVQMLLVLRTGMPELIAAACNQARIVDQARALARSFPGATFDFVVGFDTLERLFEPRYYTDMAAELAPFFAQHRLMAANRGDVSTAAVREWVGMHAGEFASRIQVMEVDPAAAAASSTRARQGLQSGGEDLPVAEPVRRYIQAHGLYKA